MHQIDIVQWCIDVCNAHVTESVRAVADPGSLGVLWWLGAVGPSASLLSTAGRPLPTTNTPFAAFLTSVSPVSHRTYPTHSKHNSKVSFMLSFALAVVSTTHCLMQLLLNLCSVHTMSPSGGCRRVSTVKPPQIVDNRQDWMVAMQPLSCACVLSACNASQGCSDAPYLQCTSGCTASGTAGDCI